MRRVKVWAPIALVGSAYASAAASFSLKIHWLMGAVVAAVGIVQFVWLVREGRRIDRAHVRRMIELKFTGNIQWMDRPEDKP